ncbi:MAG: trigger factor [Planctomycetota bacterium]|jgi:trigger factor
MADASTTPQPVDDLAPEVGVEEVGPALKRLTITVPADVIAEKLEESMGALATEAALPGFRRGKVPRRLVEKRFGSAVRNETRNQLIADAYAKAIEEHGIEPVGEPEPTEPTAELVIEAGKPLTFAVDVEVVPQFELPPLGGIEIKKPLLDITDEHVDVELKRQLLQLGTVGRIEGDFQPGDRMVGQAAVTADDRPEPLFEDTNALIVCPEPDNGGRGPVVGLMIEGLAGLIAGRRVGDTLTIETVGPESHERLEFRGAKLTITFRITAAERTEPAPVQRMVETFGLGSEQNLREEIKLALQQQRDREQAGAMRQQLYRHLLDVVEFELPERLSAAQAARTLEGHRIELLDRGLTPAEVETRLAEVRADSEAESRRQLKLFFLLRRLAKELKIEVSEQEVNGRVANMAARYGRRPEQLRAELAQSGRLETVARMILEQKTADHVIRDAAVEEVSAKQWREMYSPEAAAAGSPAKKKTTRKKAAAGSGRGKKKTDAKS